MKQFLILLLFPIYGMAMPGTPVTPPDTTQCDTLWLQSGGIKLCTILSDNGTEIRFTECPPNEIVSTIPKSATKLSPTDSIKAAKLASMCDTIWVKGGEVVTGHMKYYNSRKVVYTGCCVNCTTEKILKRKDVDSIHYATGKVVGGKNGSYTPQPEIEVKPKVETKYTEAEKEKFLKKSRIFGWIALASATIGITSFILFVAGGFAISLATVFGVGFFVFIITAAVMGGFWKKNRNKAGKGRGAKNS